MPELEEVDPPVAYLNGEFMPFSETRLPVYDLAIMQGASVTERLRTFRHQPFQVDEHLNRLNDSRQMVNWETSPDITNYSEIIAQLCEKNSQLIRPEEDLSVVIFISAGQAIGDANGLEVSSRPTICIYTANLPFAQWIDKYRNGIDLVIPDIRQVPRTTLDPRIKMRSRLHWQLADQIAREQCPGAMALLLDEHEHLTETSSGNLMILKEGVVMTPCPDATLNGISQKNVVDFCEKNGTEVLFRNLTALDLYQAEEAFLTSSTYCIMPVATLNGQSIGNRVPGPLTTQLSQLWSSEVGLDFVSQAVNVTK